MKALVACEYSGKVREALKAKGWDAWSCDLLPTDIEGQHYQGNIFDILYDGWDLLIGFPPCTYLSYVGNRWLDIDTYGEKAIQRHKNRFEGFDFFMKLWSAPIKHICLENPRGYVMQFLKPSQIIHPYYFGDEFKKATCLWLKNLPQLIHWKEDGLFHDKTWTKEPAPIVIQDNGKKISWSESLFFTLKDPKERAHVRSKTFDGIAHEMATQWTEHYLTLTHDR